MKLKQIVTLLLLSVLLSTSCISGNKEKKDKAEAYVYTALSDFELKKGEAFIPFYRDSARNALAINAVEYKDIFAAAVREFDGETGTYDIEFISLRETDGESSYKIIIDNIEIGNFQNLATAIDYEVQSNTIEKIALEKGQIIEIQFNSHSNGKIPEDDAFAYSRGRWREIAFYLSD